MSAEAGSPTEAIVKGIIGRKVGMTQIIQKDGTVKPVTVLEAGPCYVTQVRTAERDGYRLYRLALVLRKPSTSPRVR